MRRFFVARPGFEPRQTEPKSVVLPLYYRAAWPTVLPVGGAKIRQGIIFPKCILKYFGLIYCNIGRMKAERRSKPKIRLRIGA